MGAPFNGKVWHGPHGAARTPFEFGIKMSSFVVAFLGGRGANLCLAQGGIAIVLPEQLQIMKPGMNVLILAVFLAALSATATTATTVATPPGMALIPAGSFTMGNSIGDSDITDAGTVTATVSAFYMDVNLVSSNQWRTIYNWATLVGDYTFATPGVGKAGDHPVQTVNWYDCVKWCNARSEQAGKTLATRIVDTSPGSCNAEAKDMCGLFAASADPVTTRLTIAGGGQTQRILTGILSAERLNLGTRGHLAWLLQQRGKSRLAASANQRLRRI